MRLFIILLCLNWPAIQAEAPSIVPTCELPIEPGPCRATYQRWGFNPDLGVCEEFIYGGCLGNANNFDTESDCTDECD
ncbi:isoinhibitor K-like isoform X2 [Apostichopus japonicus]|uniref:isoinhibitor K-like isoform X2 n=1 Tax=Stichopus japonicus TaxID=307972 RepID=UPI003AB884FF